jgi:UrcA family protein
MFAAIRQGRIGFRTTLAAGVLGLMALGAASAQASAAAPEQVAVQYADLDINTPAGAETLYARIQAAAREICARGDERLLTQRANAARCMNIVVAHAVASVSSPKLAAVYAERTHHGMHGTV